MGVSQHLQVSFQESSDQSRITQDIYRGDFIDEIESTPLPSQDLKPRGVDQRSNQQIFAHVGLTQPIWPQHLYLGLIALIPLHQFELQSPGFADERLQYFDNQLQFDRWGARLEGMSAAFALAWRATDWLGVGGGVSLSNHSIAQSEVFLSDASYRGLSLISPRVEVKSSLSPYASISMRYISKGQGRKSSDLVHDNKDPIDWAVRGFVGLYAPEEVRVDGSSAVKIWGYPYPEGQDAINQTFTRHYRALPTRVKWGTRLDFYSTGGPIVTSSVNAKKSQKYEATPRSRWGWVTGGQWSRWSAHINQVGENSGWIDQWEVSSGVVRETAHLGWGLDLRWRPTPVPHQSGRSSYVDPSQLACSLGVRWPITRELSWQVTAQGHWLIARIDRKDLKAVDPVRDEFPVAIDEITGEPISVSEGLQTNNPGYPGYKSWGVVWSGGVNLIWHLNADGE